MFDYHPLSACYLTGTVLVSRPPQFKSVTLESSALDVMTDLRHSDAAVIEPHVSMEFANSYMIQRGVRSLLVLNQDHSLRGIITATDILGEKPLRFIQDRRVKHDEILVSDIMTSLDHLEVFPIEEVQNAKVGHVVASLRDTGRQHILVLENNTDKKPSVCGIFSLTQIERQLGVAISSTKVAANFAEIEKMLIAH
ncbi:MAG: CBS domain-containing protein [Nitrosomonadaceae bacterium]